MADEAVYQLANCHGRIHEKDRALDLLKDFSNKFPGSPLKDDAEKLAEGFRKQPAPKAK